MPRPLFYLLAVIVGLAIGLSQVALPQRQAATHDSASPDAGFPRVPPTEPNDVAKTFRTLHGFTMQLLAAEPLVTDPVALEYDENGLAWVVEMRDYPYTDKSTDKPNAERTTDAPLGRIRILEDTDGDGRFDRSDIFAEHLSWPTGLALWKGGCFVTATPDVWYLKDTDGDRRADIRRQVFTGFRKYNVQAVINNLRWGLDHKLYAAGASNGGTITKPDNPQAKPIVLGRADFVFDPNTEEFEVLAGGARFGQSFDDWGNRFICNIRNPVQHVVFENRYLARNPFLPVTTAVHDCADAGDTLPVYRASPPEPWRAARADRWREEAGQSYPRSELAGEGYFTSACGITIYRGAAYPKEFYGNAFLGEVAGNLIHRQVLESDGVTFKSRRGDENAEFVASTDNWFRPVNFTNAPDGTLHVCDMYRETIEHPWSIPDDMKPYLDLESGRDRGRLYRLAPPGFKPTTTEINLGNATPEELVATLENPSSWWRDTANRLIYERQDKACVEPLRALVRSESASAPGRICALWALEGLGGLGQSEVLSALDARDIGVRRHAVLLAERRLNSDAAVLERVASMATTEQSPSVRYQLALSLGESAGRQATDALAKLMPLGGDSPPMKAALISSARGRAAQLLFPDAASIRPRDLGSAGADLAFQLGAEVDRDAIVRILKANAAANGGLPGLIAGLAHGLKASRARLSDFAGDVESRAALEALFRNAATHAANSAAAVSTRVENIRLLAQGRFDDAAQPLVKLLASSQPVEVRLESLRALAGYGDSSVPDYLLKNYNSFTPVERAEVVEALASRTDRHGALLDAIEAKRIAVADIPPARRSLLLKAKDAAVAARAAKLFATPPGARAAIVAKFRPALKLASDVERGHKVFLRECKTCHKLRGDGFEVGPNLATVLHRSPDELLTHILDPNREVSPNYLEYVVELDDGRTLTGLVADETAAGLTLRKAENAQETVLRRNIDTLYSTGKSLMPEGMEQKLSPQDAADLIAFLLRKK